MPYVLESAVVQSSKGFSPYVVADVSNQSIGNLYIENRKIYLTLSHSALPEVVTLDMDDVRLDIDNQSQTIAEWLLENGENTLPTTEGVVELETQTINYADAEQADYTIKMVHESAHPDSYYPRSEMHDLLLTKDDVDYMWMAERCMVAVNGFFHFIEGSVHGLRVLSGGRSVIHSNKNQVSILSFANAGELIYENIDTSMISKVSDDVSMSHQLLIETTYDMYSSGRIPILVIGGYLHMLDDTYHKVGTRHLMLKTNKLSLIDRYFESRAFFDIPLPSLAPTGIDNTVHREDFHSDDVVKEYVGQENSFIVWVEADAIIKDEYHLERTGLPGTYQSPIEPVHLGLFDSGREMGYWRKDDSGVWVLTTDNALKPNYRHSSVPETELVMYNEQRETQNPFSYRMGRLLTLSTQFITLPT